MAESSRFVYVTYIRTTPEKLWRALIEPEFTRQYWVATWQESEWTPGGAWKTKTPGGRMTASGRVLEIEPKSLAAWLPIVLQILELLRVFADSRLSRFHPLTSHF